MNFPDDRSRLRALLAVVSGIGSLAAGPGASAQPQPEIPTLRTPEERFAALPGYPFEPRYVTVEPFALRMHYLEAGPPAGPLVLLLHGNPNWSYGVRELVTLLAGFGYRVIAPDLIGFGRSDKPVARDAHTYDRHEAWLTSLIERLDLRDIHLHCQDWGGLLGLRLAVQMPERFKAVCASNTDLPTGEHVSTAFRTWQRTSQVIPTYAQVVESATFTTLSDAERAAFDAPFPDEAHKAGPRQLPLEVPTDPADPDAVKNRALLERWRAWTKPFLTLFSTEDNISPDADLRLQQAIPGAAGQPHRRIPDTGHFIREDVPELMAGLLHAFFARISPMNTAAGPVNLSARARAAGGDATVIAGFVVGDAGPGPILVRAVGPRLADFGVGNWLPDPVVEVFGPAAVRLAGNDSWNEPAQAAAIRSASARAGAFTLEPEGSPADERSAAVLLEPAPGGHTAVAREATGATGVALVEIYALPESAVGRLINLSIRAEISVAEAWIVAGFVVEGAGVRRFLVRAIGPGLSAFGVAGALAGPRLEVHRAGVEGAIAVNAGWETGPGSAALLEAAGFATGAFPLARGARDAALLLELPAGAYTAVCTDASADGGGIALVEIYALP